MKSHSFGGSALDRLIVDYETVADPAEQTAIPAEPEPAPPAPPEPPEPQPAEPQEPASWAGPSQQEWQETQQALARLAEGGQEPQVPRFDPYTGQPLAGAAEQAPTMPEPWDPNYSERMVEYLDYRDQQVIERSVGPMRPFVEQEMAERGRQELQQTFETLKGELGEFDPELAEQIGDSILNRADDPYNVDTGAILRQAAERAAAIHKAAYEQGQREYREQLERGQNGHREPGAAGPATADAPDFARLDYRDIVNRHLPASQT
jgi:hypothetical protein